MGKVCSKVSGRDKQPAYTQLLATWVPTTSGGSTSGPPAYIQLHTQPGYAHPGYAQPFSAAAPMPGYAAPPYGAPAYGVSAYGHYHHRRNGMPVAAGVAAGVAGVGVGVVGGMMLENAFERRDYGCGSGGPDFIDDRRGFFGGEYTELRTDMFGDRDVTTVRTDMFGDRDVIEVRTDMCLATVTSLKNEQICSATGR